MLLGLTHPVDQSAQTLIVHLRMTGHLTVYSQPVTPDKHTHVVLDLADGGQIHFQDSRKFGRIWLVADPTAVLEKLGPEPLAAGFTVDDFAVRLATRAATIKALLLDQGVVAGVGNIYADESLHLAGLHPARPGNSLTAAEVSALHDAIQQVLQQAILGHGSSLGGSSIQNYQRPGGEPGSFQEQHRVFQRTGQPCFACGAPIERIVITQRSTHFCPQCQPA
jgi:formamidopyrimidine-DNA glycosylase